MKRKLFVSIGAVAILALTLYVVDFVVLRIKVARGDGYDLVQVHVVYQIPQKGNKAEYVPGDPQTESCVRSLFPHLGETPCWYLRRHTQQQINY